MIENATGQSPGFRNEKNRLVTTRGVTEKIGHVGGLRDQPGQFAGFGFPGGLPRVAGQSPDSAARSGFGGPIPGVPLPWGGVAFVDPGRPYGVPASGVRHSACRAQQYAATPANERPGDLHGVFHGSTPFRRS